MSNMQLDKIDSNGVATYDPDVMAFYTTEISEWNMENVVFLAQDEFGSKVQSDPVDFIVYPRYSLLIRPTRIQYPMMIMELHSGGLAYRAVQ